MNDCYCVYKHTVPNKKVYIGITKVNPNDRWANGHGYKDNKQFYNDIVLYGWLNIKHEILYSNLSEETARDIEAKLIGKFRSYKKAFGYNRAIGYSYGYVENPRDKRNKPREEYLMFCKTEEYKRLCVPNSAKCVRVYQYETDGTYVKSYESIGLCANALSVCKKCIRDCIKGKQKTCKGFLLSAYPPANFHSGVVGNC